MNLLPCPFCGHKATLMQTDQQLEDLLTLKFWVKCGNDYCTGKTMQETEEQAVEAWNKRVIFGGSRIGKTIAIKEEPVNTHQAQKATGIDSRWLKKEALAGRLSCLKVGRYRVLFNLKTLKKELSQMAAVGNARPIEADAPIHVVPYVDPTPKGGCQTCQGDGLLHVDDAHRVTVCQSCNGTGSQ